MRPALLSAHRSPGLRPTSHAIWVLHTCDGHVLAHRGFIPCLQGAWFLWVITLFTRGHGHSKGVHDQPCESTVLTKRHARMTKTQQIGHLKGKTTNPSDLFLIIYVSYQKPAFVIIVELDRKQNGKEKETWISRTCRQTSHFS